MQNTLAVVCKSGRFNLLREHNEGYARLSDPWFFMPMFQTSADVLQPSRAFIQAVGSGILSSSIYRSVDWMSSARFSCHSCPCQDHVHRPAAPLGDGCRGQPGLLHRQSGLEDPLRVDVSIDMAALGFATGEILNTAG